MKNRLLLGIVAVFFLIWILPPVNALLIDDLIAYYEFDENNSNTTLGDNTGLTSAIYARTTSDGGAGTITGLIGNAMEINGTGQVLVREGHAEIDKEIFQGIKGNQSVAWWMFQKDFAFVTTYTVFDSFGSEDGPNRNGHSHSLLNNGSMLIRILSIRS